VNREIPIFTEVQRLGERLDLTYVMKYRRKTMLEQFVERARVMPANHENGDLNASSAQLNSLFDEGDAHSRSPSAFEGASQSLGTMAVTVRLENGPNGNTTDGSPNHIEIVAKVPKVDLRPSRANGFSWESSGGSEHARLRLVRGWGGEWLGHQNLAKR
jgi:hypothetical protein